MNRQLISLEAVAVWAVVDRLSGEHGEVGYGYGYGYGDGFGYGFGYGDGSGYGYGYGDGSGPATA